MSRTIRKIHDKNYFVSWWLGTEWWAPEFHNPKEISRVEAKSTADHISGIYNIPKKFRKQTNHTRRSVDRSEISKVMKDLDYEPNMSPWSCKDSQAWNWF